MEALVKPGGLVSVQTAASAIFQEKPQDGLYVCSGYLDVYPINGTTRGNQGGTFKVEGSQKVQDMCDVLIFLELRIYNRITGLHLENNSLVSNENRRFAILIYLKINIIHL